MNIHEKKKKNGRQTSILIECNGYVSWMIFASFLHELKTN